jgi:hypothetical protein
VDCWNVIVLNSMDAVVKAAVYPLVSFGAVRLSLVDSHVEARVEAMRP